MDIFDADAHSIAQLFTGEANRIGFKIPEYQRKYDWGKDNIHRFFEDSLSGLKSLRDDEHSLTFLGSIIIVADQRARENTFDGESFEVVDGQQRLTTCSLIAASLHEEISSCTDNLAELNFDVKEWLKKESSRVRSKLVNIVYGNLLIDGIENFPFPRIIRNIDKRAPNVGELTYESYISKYLYNYARHIVDRAPPPFNHPDLNVEDKSEERFMDNAEYIKKCIATIGGDADGVEYGIEILDIESVRRANIRRLFNMLPDDQNQANRYIDLAVGDYAEQSSRLIRLITFAYYFLDRIIVTTVTTRSANYAFDIFDSLNTTGEPLTAIETFKPRIIQFENGQARRAYRGSESESHVVTVESYIDKFRSNSDKQEESKDLVISLALYVSGSKESGHLRPQRRYLRQVYDRIPNDNPEAKRALIKNLASIARYKDKFWDIDNLTGELINLENRDLIIACLAFLKELNSSLTIPILTRYYEHAVEVGDMSLFADSVKALTAFVVLRRSATAGTAGIDSDFRGIMNVGGIGDEDLGLKIGILSDRLILSIQDFKCILRERLNRRPLKINGKDSWIAKARNQPIYKSSRVLSRFVILAASNNSRPDPADLSLLSTVRPSPETEYLNYKRWLSSDLSTVEHIAPENDTDRNWDPDIYEQLETIHRLGNLTLLSREQNSAVANYSWERKKLFYKAFSAHTLQEVEDCIREGAREGVTFSDRTLELLRTMNQLPVARTISSVADWNIAHVDKRTDNLLELVWEEISPWLFDA